MLGKVHVPCDTLNIITVKFNKADPELIKAAVNKLYPGYSYNVSADGTLEIYGLRDKKSAIQTAVKMEMTRQTVLAQAKRFGWRVAEKADGKLELLRARL